LNKGKLGMTERPEAAASFIARPGETPASAAVRQSATTARSQVRPVKVIRPPAFSVGTIFSGLQTLARFSDLLWILSLFRLKVRYKQSALGWTWAALQPLALMAIYTIVFTRVTTVATGGIPYPLFVLCALLPWIFFSSSILNAVHGLVLYPNLLTKMYFPREIIPLSYLAAGFADFLIGCVILAGFMAHYRVSLTWNLLYAIPIVIVLAGFAAAIALLFSAIHVRFRDIGLAMPLLLQIWMFTIPGSRPDATGLALSAAIAFACLAIAYAYFKSCEATMADII
jgi:lipopolysaccharide transport system permease protein